MQATSHHVPVLVGPPMASSQYGPPPTSYAAPPAPRYTYGPPPLSAPHTNYQTYYVGPEGPRYSCGNGACAQYPPHPGVYNVGGQSQPAAGPYYGHQQVPVAAAPMYADQHRMVYPSQQFQMVGMPAATHYYHHQHHYPPASSADGQFVLIYKETN